MLLFCPALISVSAQSLLWKISGNGMAETSYLYGTIHLKDARIFEWKDSVYKHLAECRSYAGELDLSTETIMKAAGMMILPEGESLHSHFKSDEYEEIRRGLKTCSGYELAMFDRIKPPALIALCFADSKPDDLEATVDELLYKQAIQKQMQTFGIESIEEQMAVFDKIPDSYVLEYFRNLDRQDSEFEMLVRNYRQANLDSLWILIQDEESGSLLNDELIRVRNHRMAERIIPLIEQQSVFIAIGSGHLPGNEGVLALLRKNGFEVVPVKLW
jgi:uncharacterized protein YbaP (TraB family)